jgi:hypothetical protein
MKRNFLRLGPATILAMAGAIAFAYVRYPHWQREAQDNREMSDLRARIASKPPSKTPLPANLDTLWNQRNSLGLSSPQLDDLKSLRTEEAKQTATLRSEVQARLEEFARWVNAHQGGAPLSDIQTQSAQYSAAAAELARKRHDFWNRALNQFTVSQRARAEAKTEVKP